MSPIKKKKKRAAKKYKHAPVILITILLTITILLIVSNITSYLKGRQSSPNDSSNIGISATPSSSNESADNNQIIESIPGDSTDTHPTTDTTKQVSPPSQTDNTTNNNNTASDTAQNTPISAPTDTSPSKDEQIPNTMNISVYFIKLSKESEIIPTKYTRTVKRSVALLTETLGSLLKGPTKTEKDDGAISYIPANSKLLAVRIQNNTAFISFNEYFQFNEYGYPGMLAQLYQVVYSATEISSIHDVQFLINGKERRFFDSDGRIKTNNPITRTYLQSQKY